MKGVNPAAKKAYRRLFNSPETKKDAQLVLDDLMIRFRFYGAIPTNDLADLAKQAMVREMIEYILTMSARMSNDALSEIEQFINR